MSTKNSKKNTPQKANTNPPICSYCKMRIPFHPSNRPAIAAVTAQFPAVCQQSGRKLFIFYLIFFPHILKDFSTRHSYLYVQFRQPVLLVSSAALCLIISITAALLRESDCCCSRLKCSFRSLQRGKWHLDSLQARAWSWTRYHILLQRTQPPDARVLHCIP